MFIDSVKIWYVKGCLLKIYSLVKMSYSYIIGLNFLNAK